jgi:hypothetical protein
MNNNFDDVTARLRHSLNNTAPELSADVVANASSRTAPHVVNRGRRLRVAGAATIAVAVVAVGALVVAPTLQRAPLFTAAGNGPTSALGASEDSASSDLRIANWINYEYVPGSGLSTQSGNGSVYQLQRRGTAVDALRDAAAAFGLDGEVVKSQYFDPAYPTYVVGPEDGTAASVVVTWSGTGSWWYNDPLANPPVVCEAVPGDGTVVGGDAVAPDMCAVPEPTSSLAPSEAEARTQAKALFAATGLSVAASEIRVTVDPWQTVATASLTVNGMQTALDWSVAWSPTGKIAWAYGQSIDVVDRGSYTTVSASDAVGRLADGRWYGQAGPQYQGGMMTYATDTARAAEGPTTEPSTEPSAEPSAPAEEPVPVPSEEPGVDPGIEPDPNPTVLPDPLPTPEEPKTVIVTVDEAFETLLLMWDSKGDAWLVPGFAIQSPEGWWNSVVSLEEGVIQLPEPMQIEPLTIDGTKVEK